MKDFWFEIRQFDDQATSWRQEFEVVFMLEGTAQLQLEGDASISRIAEGDIFIANSFQLCDLHIDFGARALSLLMSPLFVAACAPEAPNPHFDCRSFLYQAEAQQPFDLIRGDFARAFRAEYKNESAHTIHQRSRVVSLLANMFRYFLSTSARENGDGGRLRLQKAVEYINAHYSEPITLVQLAEITFLSSPYLSRSFVKYMGLPFTQYLTRVRTRHAAQLLSGQQTIADIAFECGFCSSNALIEAFKQNYNETPGQYRRCLEQTASAEATSAPKTFEGFSTTFVTLMKYAEQSQQLEQSTPAKIHDLSINVDAAGIKLQHTWKRMVNVGYAHDLLGGGTQAQVKSLQENVGFEYLRCKGVLDDDMMVCTKDVEGQINTSFVYLDEVIDFVLSIGAKPMLEFGHMPTAIAAHHNKIFGRPALIAPPVSLEVWGQLIADIMSHLTQKYEQKEVEKWLFAPWVTPEFSSFQLFTMEQYVKTYLMSYHAIKQASNSYVVCGPGINVNNFAMTRSFLDQCQKNNMLPDILSFHAFNAIEPEDESNTLRVVQNNEAFHMVVSGDEKYLSNTLVQLESLLQEHNLKNMPIMLDEWSNNIWQRDLCNDTCYKSAYIFKNILENYDTFYAMGYFCLNDRIDELPPSKELFCGGFGLFTANGLSKSAFGAFKLLTSLGDTLLASGDGYFITSTQDEVQIFLYNYSHYDELYRYRYTTKLTKTKRYKVFNECTEQAYHMCLEGLEAGTHKVCHYSISPNGGSAFDAWLAMGAPEPPSAHELELLKTQCEPLYRTELLRVKQKVTLKASLVPHEIQLITVSRKKLNI